MHKRIPALEEFKDVFLEEIPRLPPKRDLEFSIELTLGSVPTSKAPYRMPCTRIGGTQTAVAGINRERVYLTPCVPLGSTDFVRK